MKRALSFLISILLYVSTAHACDGPYLIRYGTTNVWDFNLFVPDGSVYKTDATFGDTDITYTKNSGTVTTYPGSNVVIKSPQYKMTLSSTITSTARLHINVVKDGTWFPKCVDFWTYGNRLAQYQFDLNNPLDKINLAQSADTNSITIAASENFATNTLAGNNIVFIADATTGKYQTQCICSNSQSTDKLTLCQPWQTIPTGSIYYMILPAYHCSTN